MTERGPTLGKFLIMGYQKNEIEKKRQFLLESDGRASFVSKNRSEKFDEAQDLQSRKRVKHLHHWRISDNANRRAAPKQKSPSISERASRITSASVYYQLPTYRVYLDGALFT